MNNVYNYTTTINKINITENLDKYYDIGLTLLLLFGLVLLFIGISYCVLKYIFNKLSCFTKLFLSLSLIIAISGTFTGIALIIYNKINDN